jgi:thiamine transport system ATP-binding protein
MLTVRGLTVRFAATTALDGVDLDVADGTVLGVLGPSGCGKSTLLRAIAGLQPADAGTVAWDGVPIDGTPVHRREFGLMFQDYALFPHLDVAGNVAFGLRMHGHDGASVRDQVVAALEMVGLAGYDDRAVATLSGGEQQRVALARSLAPAPRLLMLDEPLGALDRTLRDRLMVEFHDLFARHGITAIYVTHDQEEAFAVADRIVVLREGRVVGAGSPEELWQDPGNEFVARFLGFTNIVTATIDNGVADAGWARFPVSASDPAGTRRIALRTDGFRVDAAGPVAATVVSRTFRAGRYETVLQVTGGPQLHALLAAPLPAGAAVRLSVSPDAIIDLG